MDIDHKCSTNAYLTLLSFFSLSFFVHSVFSSFPRFYHFNVFDLLFFKCFYTSIKKIYYFHILHLWVANPLASPTISLLFHLVTVLPSGPGCLSAACLSQVQAIEPRRRRVLQCAHN